jgi:tRNA(Met) C34 N-acetyltransferase TmcA
MEEDMGAEIREIREREPKGARHDKREKFVELAQRRTVNAIRSIRTLAKLGNKAHYTYDERDVKKIVQALSREIEALRAKMTNTGSKDSVEFSL